MKKLIKGNYLFLCFKLLATLTVVALGFFLIIASSIGPPDERMLDLIGYGTCNKEKPEAAAQYWDIGTENKFNKCAQYSKHFANSLEAAKKCHLDYFGFSESDIDFISTFCTFRLTGTCESIVDPTRDVDVSAESQSDAITCQTSIENCQWSVQSVGTCVPTQR